MRFRQVQRHHIPVEHGSPSGIHDIYTSVLVESGNEKDGHRENGLCGLDLLLHGLVLPDSFAIAFSHE
jgi:hypothetical protein